MGDCFPYAFRSAPERLAIALVIYWETEMDANYM